MSRPDTICPSFFWCPSALTIVHTQNVCGSGISWMPSPYLPPQYTSITMDNEDNPTAVLSTLHTIPNDLNKDWDNEVVPMLISSVYSLVVVLLDELLDDERILTRSSSGFVLHSYLYPTSINILMGISQYNFLLLIFYC